MKDSSVHWLAQFSLQVAPSRVFSRDRIGQGFFSVCASLSQSE